VKVQKNFYNVAYTLYYAKNIIILLLCTWMFSKIRIDTLKPLFECF